MVFCLNDRATLPGDMRFQEVNFSDILDITREIKNQLQREKNIAQAAKLIEDRE
jgi:hypothetical protein